MVQLKQRKQVEHNACYWWSSYGPFPPADGQANRPHVGRVIAHYRKMRGWSAARLGAALGIQWRQVYNLERSPELPKSFTRRNMLLRALNVPPVLLGAVAADDLLPSSASKQKSPLPPSTAEAYESILQLSWSAYYSSGTQGASQTVDYWTEGLEDLTKQGQNDHLRAMLCRFHQFSAAAARDRHDFSTSITRANQALTIALGLGQAELIASSLLRRARVYGEMGERAQSIADLERALPYAERSRDPLKCYTKLCLAEAYSLAYPNDLQYKQKSVVLLDSVGRIVRARGVLDGDGHFIKVDIPGFMMLRGDVFRRFADLSEADNALLIAQKQLPRHFVRWQGNLLVSEAYLYADEHDIEAACEAAFDALAIVNETRSVSTRAKIERLYTRLNHQAPQLTLVKEFGERLQIV